MILFLQYKIRHFFPLSQVKALSNQLAEANRELDAIAKRLEKRSTTLIDAEGKRKDAMALVKGLQKKNLLATNDLQDLTSRCPDSSSRVQD